MYQTRHCHFRIWIVVLIVAQIVANRISADDRYPLESADTSSPKSTLKSFLEGMHEASLVTQTQGRLTSKPEHEAIRNRILRCLDLSDLAPAVRKSLAKEAAVCLKETLDRIELPPESQWPDSDQVAEQSLTKWTIPHTEIALEKVVDGPRKGEFLFNTITVDRATEFYEIVKARDYISRETATPGFYERFISEPGWMIPVSLLPDWSRTRWLGQAIWQWIGLVLVLLFASALMLWMYMIGRWRAKSMRSNLRRYWITLFFPALAMLVPLIAEYFVVEQLQIFGELVVAISFTLQIILLLAVTVLVVSLGNRLAELLIATPWIEPVGLDAQLVRLACRVLSLIGAVIIVLEGGQRLGISLTTLLAGAGVGGLALALAAQDTLRNILGSMMIMLDKPFKIGERIVAKGFDGTVEDIGLRSTRIRLLTGHQVSIPNEEMAVAEIENIGRRPFIRQSTMIELPSKTASAKIEQALEILREILQDHEGMSDDFPPRVHLSDVGESSIRILMMYWYHPPSYWDFVAFHERVTLQFAQRFESEGIPFAAPALNVYLQQSK